MKIYLLLVVMSLVSCTNAQKSSEQKIEKKEMSNIITLGGGCFWCTEAVFQRLEGVDTVISGYMGGHTQNPTYKEICTGETGHAEVIQVHFDPEKISLEEIFEVFFATHDPTTLNRQGADVGTQYRSVIFYENEQQKSLAEKTIAALNQANVFDNLIVTEISPAATFYPAEDYHQNYYNLNGSQPFCSFVISPKVQKLEKVFKEKLKSKQK